MFFLFTLTKRREKRKEKNIMKENRKLNDNDMLSTYIHHISSVVGIRI